MGKVIISDYAAFIENQNIEYCKLLPKDDKFPIGTVVLAKVLNVVPNLQAAFLSLDHNKTMGFLPLKDVEQAIVTNRVIETGSILPGDEVLVQVDREAMKTKDIGLSSKVEVKGKYCLIHNGNGKLFLSHKLKAFEKKQIHDLLIRRAISTKKGEVLQYHDITIVLRTNAIQPMKQGDGEELARDIEETIEKFLSLKRKALTRSVYTVLEKPSLWLEELNEEIQQCGFEIEEYVTDQTNIHSFLMEKGMEPIRFYQDDSVSLTTLYALETKFQQLLDKKVWLPSGGYLYIEQMEALTVVDVNTGKMTKSMEPEEAHRKVNIEAAIEVARQIRLRNISGIIIIDFIKHKSDEYLKEIQEILKTNVTKDYSKVEVIGYTKLGLMEMTRRKKHRSLNESVNCQINL